MEILTNINWSVMTIQKLRLLLLRLLILKLYSMSVLNSNYFKLIIPLWLWIFSLQSLIKVANSQKDIFVFDMSPNYWTKLLSVNMRLCSFSLLNHLKTMGCLSMIIKSKKIKDGLISERFSQFFTTLNRMCQITIPNFSTQCTFFEEEPKGKTFCD